MEHKKEVIEYRKKYFDLIVKTDRIEREKAEAAVKELCEFQNFKFAPIVWCESPHQAAKIFDMIMYLQTKHKLENVEGGWLGGCTKLKIKNPNDGALLVKELEVICNKDKKFKSPKRSKNYIHFSHYGTEDAYWVAYHRFCQNVLNKKLSATESKELDIFEKIVENSGWISHYDTVIFICDRLTSISYETPVNFEADNPPRLHAEKDAAITYRDGFKLYVIEGVQVPEDVVTKEQTSDMVLKEENDEIRRIRLNRYPGGLARFLEDIKAEKVEMDFHEFNGMRVLYKVEIRGALQQWLLVADPSTSRSYFMEVPSVIEEEDLSFDTIGDNKIDTCEKADKWLAAGITGTQRGRT